ncbi:MAG: peptidoglycan DD-metalloendopeptidase family protein [Hallerella succinigenes]|uniref:murein hydrolase activator EnvC family protein n=1 Tax=Hallerella succinigenes TaxID=1896222 RepID=UPI000D0CBB5A|nr:peptidoglycan DD-metalloendopeptidase family protein [Hallerella succinigenes]MDD6092648.1 peptidoglycan DD-metalloendopeptidase family protein [Hallerella succinigenes]
MLMRRLFVLFVLLSLVAAPSFATRKSTSSQLAKQRAELKKLESNLAKQRQKVKLLESEEKGVLNTIAILDENLNRTKEYVQLLAKNESTVKTSLSEINRTLDSLDREIALRNEAMRLRIRELYIHGDMGTVEEILAALRGETSPDGQIYYVNRLLSEDREKVEKLSWLLRERSLKKREASNRLSELHTLQSKKAAEEAGLKTQIQTQGSVLATVQKSKNLQRRAIQEIERNQKTILSLIRQLEKKRASEIAQAKKAKQKKKKNDKSSKPLVKLPKEPVKPIGPKCMPLDGSVISEYGMHEHPVLHIMTRNLGVEIRGKKGAKIKSAAAGTVAMVTEIDGRGPSVIVEHEGGVYSVYGHMSAIRVKEGDKVKNCQDLGTVGDIGSLNGIKLYFQVSEGTETVDPLRWLRTK